MTTPLLNGQGNVVQASTAINPIDGGLVGSIAVTDPVTGYKQSVNSSGQAAVGALPVSAPVAIVPSDVTTVTPGDLGTTFVISTVGNVKVGFANGVTWTIPFPATGVFIINISINQIFVTGTTAVATYFANF
jgi:hypothetical protein